MFPRTTRLGDAYVATEYVVRLPGREVALRVDVRAPAAERLLGRAKARSGVYVTACNPLSAARGRAANASANGRLAAAARRRGWRILPGEGRAIAGDWPPEASFLVLGSSPRAAAALGRLFRQNAVVLVQAGRAPALLPLA